jgi:type VI secretion system protein ImpI
MQIQLEIINRNGLERGVVTRFIVSDAPQTIGRGKKADWVLPDAGRFLSSLHCRIARAHDGFEIAVLSANGAVLNGRDIGSGKTVTLADGDRLELGPYLMLVTLLPSDKVGDKTVVLGRRAGAAADEKTVVLLAKRPAAPAVKPVVPLNAGWTETARAVRYPAHPAESSSHALGVEFVRAFSEGAQIDPEVLAGRTNKEFARELGGAMRKAAQGLSSLAVSARDLRTLVRSQEKLRIDQLDDAPGSGVLRALFGAGGSGYRRAEQAVGDLADDLQSHDAAVFHAMQTALFRLLNEISPMAIEAETGSAFPRSKRAKSWERYAAKWQSLSAAGENGMLDVFLDYFREAYDEKMSGR